MTRQRKFGSVAAIGGLSAAGALLSGLPAASADELADLKANQELLQKRIDQLSQAPPPGPTGPYVPGFGPETRAAAAPVTVGSFPRSFLIPGTDTSLRIGGFADTHVMWWMKGAQNGTALNGQGGNPGPRTDGLGGTGGLPSIPLNNAVGHSRSGTFDISSRFSRLLFDARTPTAWGEVKAYFEVDFAHNNENVVEHQQQIVTNGWTLRLRKAYGTMGGLLAGQETGSFHDSDADPELADTGGLAASAGRSRVPQVKYTYQGPYGTVFSVAAENPDAEAVTPRGKISTDSSQVTTAAPCSVTGNTLANLPATTACVSSSAFLDPLKSSWPEMTGTARINQPWGHLQVGLMVRGSDLNDGQYLDQKFVGYAGTISGDAHPFSGVPGALGKDDLGFGTTLGTNVGGQIANGLGPSSNFGGVLNVPGFGSVNPLQNAQWNTPNSPTRQAYDRQVRTGDTNSGSAWIWYQHWWTENLRSTVSASGMYNYANSALIAGCTSCNKTLAMLHANLFWSPVAFVDFAAEYAYGHRVTSQNFKGDANVLMGMMRVRF